MCNLSSDTVRLHSSAASNQVRLLYTTLRYFFCLPADDGHSFFRAFFALSRQHGAVEALVGSNGSILCVGVVLRHID